MFLTNKKMISANVVQDIFEHLFDWMKHLDDLTDYNIPKTSSFAFFSNIANLSDSKKKLKSELHMLWANLHSAKAAKYKMDLDGNPQSWHLQHNAVQEFYKDYPSKLIQRLVKAVLSSPATVVDDERGFLELHQSQLRNEPDYYPQQLWS